MNDLRIRFLIVDDDRSIRRLCMTVGNSLGFECYEAESAERALFLVESDAPDLVLADLMMPNMSGLDFLEQIKKAQPRTEVSIMTGHGSIEAAVKAMRMGAYDFITKPFRLEELKLLLQRMEEKARLVAENQFLRERVSTDIELNGIVGTSAKIQDVMRMVARLKDTRTPVLITGESYPLSRRLSQTAFCCGGLRFTRTNPDRKRALRLRERCVYRGITIQRGPIPGSQRWHDIPR
jgi:DNA-binding NtrC family response regulator